MGGKAGKNDNVTMLAERMQMETGLFHVKKRSSNTNKEDSNKYGKESKKKS